MKKFRGSSQLSLDAKGRIMLPARHREALSEICDGELIVTVDTYQPCLLIYPVNEWEVIQDKIDALPSLNKVTRMIQRRLVGNAHDVSIDAGGRLLLPSKHRKFAQLEKKVLLVGQGKKFELWNEEAWDSYHDDSLIEGEDELPLALEELSL